MTLRKIFISFTIILIPLLMSACKKSSPHPSKIHTNSPDSLNLSGKSKAYRSGVADGCSTAKESYTKDHDAFNTNVDYYNGWFTGRMYCEPTQIRTTRMMR